MRVDHKTQTQQVRIADMVRCPPAENPNRMSAEAFALLCEAIRAGDFNQPVLLSLRDDCITYDVVDGNHRVEAAEQCGLDSLPAVVRRYTPEQIAVYRLGMNRLRGELDLGIARGVVQDLVANGWGAGELVLTGFTADELGELIAAAKPDEDLLAAAGAVDVAPEPAVAGKPFVLEIAFVDKGQYQLARRKLRQAAGASKDLARGLLNVLGEEG